MYNKFNLLNHVAGDVCFNFILDKLPKNREKQHCSPLDKGQKLTV